jgi:hypothetical protein
MPTNTKFDIEPCRGVVWSTEDFVEKVFELRRSVDDKKLLYRGHSKSCYKLKPKVGRPLIYAGKTLTLKKSSEISLLHRFRRRAYPQVERTITAGEAIFIAQHHGLPTRLLDWTANALFALYLACFEYHTDDAKVWAMLRQPDQEHNVDAFELAQIRTELKLFNYRKSGGPSDDAIKIVHPIFNTARILAQDGAFTIHSHPKKSLEDDYDGREFNEKNLDILRLYWWHVPKTSKEKIIRGLSGLGITHRSVYPDLDGIAKSLWETEVLWL